jgi:hypothetical protein
MAGQPQDGILEQIIEAFTDGEFEEIEGLVQQGLDAGLGRVRSSTRA